jgi:hypothetical protein
MMKSKLRDNKTRQIDDKNRSALDETIKVKKGFSQKAKKNLKRIAREKGDKSIKMRPNEKIEFNPEQIGLVETECYDLDTGKSKTILLDLESIRKTERELNRLVNLATGERMRIRY